GLGTACFVLGAILLDLKRPTEALEPMQQAVLHLDAIFQEKPGRPERRKALSKALFHLGEIQRRLSRPAEAAATALQRGKVWPRDRDEVYEVACELGRCMKTVGGKSTLSPAEEAERRRYGDQAMAVLKRAVAIGLRDVPAAAKDEDLALLRDRQDFQALVRGG